MIDTSRLAFPKGSSKLDRAIASKADRLEDERQLRAWATAVKARDQWKDRKTGQRVLKTLSLDPDRAEAHHVVSKDDWTVRHDLRNGLCLSLKTHLDVEMGKYRIEGTQFFRKGGCRYVDCTYAVIFVRT